MNDNISSNGLAHQLYTYEQVAWNEHVQTWSGGLVTPLGCAVLAAITAEEDDVASVVRAHTTETQDEE